MKTSFEALGLSPSICASLTKSGYDAPTPIQTKAIPHVLRGKDVLACAQTGTGKTAAFGLPIVQDLMTRKPSRGPAPIRALILAPTRELAAQLGASLTKYAGARGPRSFVVFGGVGKHKQQEALRRGVDILVATPGRLMDLMGDGTVVLDDVDTLVLDEADRMLDMGFIRDVRKITRALPRDRQTLLFSATMPKEIRQLAKDIQRSPVSIAVDPVSSTVEPIEQSVYFVEKAAKTSLLLQLLDESGADRALVFTRTKHGANRLSQKLVRAGVSSAAIHGNKSQNSRVTTLRRFKDREIRVVVATDVAARGIDIKELSHVVNFDLPNEPESYVHRVGRTGRAGSTGIAISFCSKEERPYLADIEKLIARRLDRMKAEVEAPMPWKAASRSEKPRRTRSRPEARPTEATTEKPRRRRRRSRRRRPQGVSQARA